MLGNILRPLFVLIVAATALALLFTFGVVILIMIAIATPIAYLYMRFKNPELFEAMKNFKTASYTQGANHQQNNSPRQKDDSIIEVEYERVDDNK
jgi:hypothetical protein